MKATATMNAVCVIIGCQADVMNRSKRVGTSSAGMSVKLKDRDWKRYCTLQPPTTE